MSQYSFRGNAFRIEDFQKATPFCSFLPAVAGPDGKPLWAFYASVGQAMGGFGATSKDSPIAPFDSSHLGYQNIPIRGFRTFLKFKGKDYAPFYGESSAKRNMETSLSSLYIEEIGEGYTYSVSYCGIPRESFPGLIRKVVLTNTTDKPVAYSLVDGLPVILPYGLSNSDYKQLVSLMEAYCEVNGLSDRLAYAKFKTSTGDNSVVSMNNKGNGFFAKDENGELLLPIADRSLVFGEDLSLLTAHPFFDKAYADFVAQPQQRENKLPCAFFAVEGKLKAKESKTIYEVYGSFLAEEDYRAAAEKLTVPYIEELRCLNESLIADLVKPAKCLTADPKMDLFIAQSYLDNNLRGGFPVNLGSKDEPVPYYLYGRKHGDMERDYNDFVIPASYCSSGPGNFRDVNQNRRNDLFFAPYVGDYNIRLFFDLIQVDGQNPLNVKPKSFKIKDQKALAGVLTRIEEPYRTKLKGILSKNYVPGDLITYLIDGAHLDKKDAASLASEIYEVSEQETEANFAEGYWIDHWTYNVDLLENYSSVFPDKEEALLFGEGYRYFHSPVYVEPRKEKYSLLPDGRIRQYGAIDLEGLKERCRKEGIDIKKTDWLSDKKGRYVSANLAEKIAGLILVKFSTLDSRQMGIEMECEKPGWNDAMNGLPGLFASGLSETVELLRIVNYAKNHLLPFANRNISLLSEQYDLYLALKKNLPLLLQKEITSFEYWDRATSAREELRLKCRDHVSGKKKEVSVSELLSLYEQMARVLHDGILKAKEVGGGIIPSYLIYRVTKYEKTGHVNHLGYETVRALEFELETIPPFLEASARALKLGSDFVTQEDLKAIKASDLYDKKLGIFKTCAAIDDAPFEIGRVHAFTKGWLERECDFLHMSYKYLLGLLKAGYGEEWEKESAKNLTIHMDPSVYGRSPTEASSFIVPTCNPDESKHGRGFFARLSGANAELLNMYVILFAGDSVFTLKDGELCLNLRPRLPKKAYGSEGKASFLLFGNCEVIYENKKKIDTLKSPYKVTYVIGGKEYTEVKGRLAELIRSGEIESFTARIDS